LNGKVKVETLEEISIGKVISGRDEEGGREGGVTCYRIN
jgi:hypothetical protein